MIYKVWIQIEEIDESMNHYLNMDEPIEAGKFDTETQAENFIEGKLLKSRPRWPWIISFILLCATLFIIWLTFGLLFEGVGS